MKKYITFIVCVAVTLTASISDVFSQNSPYMLEKIIISMPSGGNISKKRDQAVKKATKQGFNQLLQNITLTEDWLRHDEVIASVNWNEILEKFVIVKEETSPRYNLTLNLFFNRNIVKDLLHSLKIPYAESRKLKLLIMPLMDSENRLLLWGEDNSWRTAISGINTEQHLLDISIPIGDMNEVTNITAEMVNLGAEDILLNLAKQYNTDGVIVSYLSQYSSNGVLILNAENRWYGSKNIPTTTAQYAVREDETYEQGLQKLATISYNKMEQIWQKSGVVQINQQGKVFVRFSPKSAADLERLTSLLESFNTVEKVQLRVLNIENSLFEISYFGEAQNIANLMVNKGLELSFKGSLWWVSFRD